MVTIRPYCEKDYSRVREVCLRAANDFDEFNGFETPAAKFILTTYNDYYTQCEPQNCFVAANENDEAVGYIICAENCAAWRKAFMRDYYPRLKELNKSAYTLDALGEIIIHSAFAKKYPAHLHIDMAKDYRGQGIGSKMMDTLVCHLRANGVPGVQLCVGADNARGINFYKKYGFKVLVRIATGVAMGLEIKTEGADK